jgi:hypothetical protein
MLHRRQVAASSLGLSQLGAMPRRWADFFNFNRHANGQVA